MPKVKTEFFIARRLSHSGSDRRNVMVRIATATVAISVAVMVIALAVILGFKDAVSANLVGFAGHVQVVNLDGNTSFETTPITRNDSLVKSISSLSGFSSLNAYAVKGGIMKTEDAMEGVMVKGVGGDYDWSFFETVLTKGALPRINDTIRTKDLLISRTLASAMRLDVEDRIVMLFVQADAPPRHDRFKVSGIYDTGLEELDKVVVMTDIRNVQRLNKWTDDQITGYEADALRFSELDRLAGDIYDITLDIPLPEGEYLKVVTVKDRYPNLFDWLKAHDVNAAVIIVIMLLVALLNMVSALLIIVLERTRMIGILKSLGMANGPLQRLFLVRSAYILGRGMIWGNIIGIGLSLVQKYTHVLKLDQSGYSLSEVPIELGAGWLIALNAGTFALLLLLLAIPTMIVSQIKPEKTIRYQ